MYEQARTARTDAVRLDVPFTFRKRSPFSSMISYMFSSPVLAAPASSACCSSALAPSSFMSSAAMTASPVIGSEGSASFSYGKELSAGASGASCQASTAGASGSGDSSADCSSGVLVIQAPWRSLARQALSQPAPIALVEAKRVARMANLFIVSEFGEIVLFGN